MNHTLKYFISSCLFLCVTLSFGQIKVDTLNIQQLETVAPKTSADKVPTFPMRYGLNIGIDLFSLSRSIYDKSFDGLELSADYRLTKNWYAAAELGQTKMTRNQLTYGFTANGQFIKLGANYNVFENWLDGEDQIYVGFRYGFSTFSQTLNWYHVYTTDPYFPDHIIDSNKKYSSLSAHWGEFVTGIKTNLTKNIFMGFSLRLTGLITQKQPDNFENMYIPGYGKKYSGNIGVGFNYTISYFIPLYKSKTNKVPQVDDSPKYDLQGNEMIKDDLRTIQNNKNKVQ